MVNSMNPQYLTWGIIREFKNKNSSIPLCFSEFIDNSIASFESRNDYSKNLNITINCYSDIYKSAKRYEIIDNAYGIDDLDSAMTTYKSISSKDTKSKNQYGIGMKFGIFWLGKIGEIYTKKSPSDIKRGKFTTKLNDNNFDDNSNVFNNITEEYECDLLKNYDHGTAIIINDIYTSNKNIFANVENNINKLKDFLGYRFYNYLDNKNNKFIFTIKINLFDNDDKLIGSYDIEPNNLLVEDKVFNIKNMFDNVDDINNHKKYHQKLIDELIQKHDFYKKYFEKLYNGEPLIFDDEILKIKINSKDHYKPVEVKIKFGIMNKPCQYKNGLSILHSNRYIHHPPTALKETNFVNNYSWCGDREFNGVYKWAIGELSLSDIPYNEDCKYIKPDDNKASIMFSSDMNNNLYTEKLFKESIVEFIRDRVEFLNFIKDLNYKNDIKEIIESNKKNNTISGNLIVESGNAYSFNLNSFSRFKFIDNNFSFRLDNDLSPDDNILTCELINNEKVYFINKNYKNLKKETLEINFYLLLCIFYEIINKYDNSITLEEIFSSLQRNDND